MTIDSLPLDAKEQAFLSLINELEVNFQLLISTDEIFGLKIGKIFPGVKTCSLP